LDDDFIWQFFDKNHFQVKEQANCSPAPATGSDIFAGKISVRSTSGQGRFTQLNKRTVKANRPPWSKSPRFWLAGLKYFVLKNKWSGSSILRDLRVCDIK
jgi:hypothetical protein